MKDAFSFPFISRGGPVYAAIDLGTNNCRLLVAKPDDENDFQVITSFSRVVRLGDGLEQTNALSRDSMDRAIQALLMCARKMRKYRVSHVSCVATEACRRAQNYRAFLDRALHETGIRLEVISTEREAELSVHGCYKLLGRQPYALQFDIGGGSTEISLLTNGEESDIPVIIDSVSLPWGVVTLADRHQPFDSAAYQSVVHHIMSGLKTFHKKHDLEKKIRENAIEMLGTSGTITTVASIFLNQRRYNRREVDGFTMNFSDIYHTIQRVMITDEDKRGRFGAVGEERVDLVLPGCALLEAICRQWPIGNLTIADRGLREGLLYQMMKKDGYTK